MLFLSLSHVKKAFCCLFLVFCLFCLPGCRHTGISSVEQALMARTYAIAYMCGLLNLVPHEVERDYYIECHISTGYMHVFFYLRKHFPYATSPLTSSPMLEKYIFDCVTVIIDPSGKITSVYEHKG